MEKKILIGLDLSFNSTGITVTYMEDSTPKIIQFYRVVFDDENNKTRKVYKPRDIPNINQVTYRMPKNVYFETDSYDNNSKEQLATTLRAMICSKRICGILSNVYNRFTPDIVVCTIENYIMPSFAGPNSLKNVSGLILLQGYVREFIIKLYIATGLNLYLYMPSPSANKKFFSGNGAADKQQMIDSFITNYDGNKLLPNLDHGKVDDVIDSFSLLCYGLNKYLTIDSTSETKYNSTIEQL